MSDENSIDSTDTTVRLHMTKEQAEAYNNFIDYMVKLYHEYGYLLDKGDA